MSAALARLGRALEPAFPYVFVGQQIAAMLGRTVVNASFWLRRS